MQLFGRHSVDDTPDLQRIIDLPRRTWADEDLAKLAERMTAVLKMPGGEMSLRPLQALALHDLYTEGGLAAMLSVGTGKTLISLLAPYILKAKRPMLLLPACLIEKTERERLVLVKHWRGLTSMRMCSYEMLGVERGANILIDYKPDLLVMDEAQKAKNKNVARVRRLARYLRDYPDTRVVVMSGTFMKHSLKDYAHLLRWALKNPPVPLLDGDVFEWADAMDQEVNPLARRRAGGLLKLCTPQERRDNDEVTAARLGFQRRLVETPGIVATRAGDQVACSLYIEAVPYTMAPILEKYYTDLRNDMVTPDGWDLFMATEIYRHARELALGHHGIWDPRPPEEWRAARKAWAHFVREVLSETEDYDSELQVKHACARGDLDRELYDHWMKIEPTFEIHPKAVWHDDAALKVCEAWMKKGPGIVWVDHVFYAQELARRTGAAYYRQDGKTEDGQFIEDADCSKAIIASTKSNKEGRNLQGRDREDGTRWRGFSRNLLTACPSAADDIEQLIGRTHRDGQQADEVIVDVLLGCREHAEAWLKAVAGAKAARDTLGQPQKILIADVIGFPTELQLNAMKGAMWNAPPREKSLRDLIYAGRPA